MPLVCGPRLARGLPRPDITTVTGPHRRDHTGTTRSQRRPATAGPSRHRAQSSPEAGRSPLSRAGPAVAHV